jgi:hypothetical protein
MAKTAQRKSQKKKGFVPEAELPQRVNYMILIAGVITVIIGYMVMIAGDATSPLSVTIAPIILVIGYCGIIPLGIIYKKKIIKAVE